MKNTIFFFCLRCIWSTLWIFVLRGVSTCHQNKWKKIGWLKAKTNEINYLLCKLDFILKNFCKVLKSKYSWWFPISVTSVYLMFIAYMYVSNCNNILEQFYEIIRVKCEQLMRVIWKWCVPVCLNSVIRYLEEP